MSRPKFNTPIEIMEEYIRAIEKLGRKVFITGRIKGICRDKDDDDKIECGIIANADYLITGDKDLLVMGFYQNLRIVTMSEYLEIVSR